MEYGTGSEDGMETISGSTNESKAQLIAAAPKASGIYRLPPELLDIVVAEYVNSMGGRYPDHDHSRFEFYDSDLEYEAHRGVGLLRLVHSNLLLPHLDAQLFQSSVVRLPRHNERYAALLADRRSFTYAKRFQLILEDSQALLGPENENLINDLIENVSSSVCKVILGWEHRDLDYSDTLQWEHEYESLQLFMPAIFSSFPAMKILSLYGITWLYYLPAISVMAPCLSHVHLCGLDQYRNGESDPIIGNFDRAFSGDTPLAHHWSLPMRPLKLLEVRGWRAGILQSYFAKLQLRAEEVEVVQNWTDQGDNATWWRLNTSDLRVWLTSPLLVETLKSLRCWDVMQYENRTDAEDKLRTRWAGVREVYQGKGIKMKVCFQHEYGRGDDWLQLV